MHGDRHARQVGQQGNMQHCQAGTVRQSCQCPPAAEEHSSKPLHEHVQVCVALDNIIIYNLAGNLSEPKLTDHVTEHLMYDPGFAGLAAQSKYLPGQLDTFRDTCIPTLQGWFRYPGSVPRHQRPIAQFRYLAIFLLDLEQASPGPTRDTRFASSAKCQCQLTLARSNLAPIFLTSE